MSPEVSLYGPSTPRRSTISKHWIHQVHFMAPTCLQINKHKSPDPLSLSARLFHKQNTIFYHKTPISLHYMQQIGPN